MARASSGTARCMRMYVGVYVCRLNTTSWSEPKLGPALDEKNTYIHRYAGAHRYADAARWRRRVQQHSWMGRRPQREQRPRAAFVMLKVLTKRMNCTQPCDSRRCCFRPYHPREWYARGQAA